MTTRGLRVTVDDEVIEGVTSWATPGGVLLLLTFADGSHRGITGFVEFTIGPAQSQ